MDAVLFDTSVYLNAFRGNPDSIFVLQDKRLKTTLWLSGVVLEELFAGASQKGQSAVERLQLDFEKARRILVPTLADWAATGKILGCLGSKYGYEEIGKGRLTNDALIAISAGRAGITVITNNVRDFSRLAEFAAFAWSTPQ